MRDKIDKFKKDYYLKISYDENNDVIDIIGNKSGLEYLANVCLHLVTKKEPEHWHLSFAFNSLTEDSVEETIISFKPGLHGKEETPQLAQEKSYDGTKWIPK